MRKWILRIFKLPLILLITAIVGVLLWELYFAYGQPPEPLTPEAFTKWKTVKILTPQRYVWLIVRNPETTGTVRAVALAVRSKDMILVGYKYFENGGPRSFAYSSEKEKIVENKLTEEQTQQCLECHKYGRYVREVSSGDAG